MHASDFQGFPSQTKVAVVYLRCSHILLLQKKTFLGGAPPPPSPPQKKPMKEWPYFSLSSFFLPKLFFLSLLIIPPRVSGLSLPLFLLPDQHTARVEPSTLATLYRDAFRSGATTFPRHLVTRSAPTVALAMRRAAWTSHSSPRNVRNMSCYVQPARRNKKKIRVLCVLVGFVQKENKKHHPPQFVTITLSRKRNVVVGTQQEEEKKKRCIQKSSRYMGNPGECCG